MLGTYLVRFFISAVLYLTEYVWLILYRMSYIKANVHQVHRYLTAYLSSGGSFPEKENSRIRNLASEVCT